MLPRHIYSHPELARNKGGVPDALGGGRASTARHSIVVHNMTPFGRSATPVLMMRPALTPAIRRDGKRNSLAEALSKRATKSMTSLAPSSAIRTAAAGAAGDGWGQAKSSQDSVGLSPRASSNSTRRMSAASAGNAGKSADDEQGGQQKPSDHKSHDTNEAVLSEENSSPGATSASAKIPPRMNPIELPRPALSPATDEAVNTLERVCFE
mmetsp:Transcript_28970/g.40381  ORF Transcript_28970/g.40381 Transcript_28970/m.40381 type:complete len:210 (-) Transcript_28970:1-630(-)